MKTRALRTLALASALLAGFAPAAGAQSADARRVSIGAKNFTESAILAELMAQMLEEHAGLAVTRRYQLGGTMICHNALKSGEIDAYAEYTGTAWAAVLGEARKARSPLRTFFHVQRRYEEEHGLRWLRPFGLENRYALAMSDAKAAELGITRISDLLEHQSKLRAGFGVEFARRPDGYPGLAETYGLELPIRTLEHGLAYEAIRSGGIDVMDAYSTDGKLLRYRLRVLDDDRSFFPPYHAAPVVRVEALERFPRMHPALERLAFRISDAQAQALNFVVENDGVKTSAAARAFLEIEALVKGSRAEARDARAALRRVLKQAPEAGATESKRPGLWQLFREESDYLLRLILEHIGLTLAAVLLASIVAIPLGIALKTRPRLRAVALGAAGVLQTLPSLALLAFLIPILGLGIPCAIAALFLYALLPILRNTYTGISEVDPDLVDAATGMGLRPEQVLKHVELPLALRTIMAGLRTATVISIGVATLAAFVGAGGLGQPIVQGLYMGDNALILFGALPAAGLAILADLSLAGIESATQAGRRG